jgi:hypothetical protein
VRLAAHAETVAKAERRTVAGIHPGDHPVQVELIQGQVQHGAGGLGRIAVAGVAWVEYPADRTATMLSTGEEEHRVSDQLPRRGQLHAERQGLTFPRDHPPGPSVGQLLCDHLRVHRLESPRGKRHLAVDRTQRGRGRRHFQRRRGRRGGGLAGSIA